MPSSTALLTPAHLHGIGAVEQMGPFHGFLWFLLALKKKKKVKKLAFLVLNIVDNIMGDKTALHVVGVQQIIKLLSINSKH